MRFDQTQIAIRQRGPWEILDLSLRVASIYAKPLLISSLILGLPVALINARLLHWVIADELSGITILRYVWLMGLLVYVETPIVTLPTSSLLGRTMFRQDLAWRAVLADVWRVFPGILWTQGVTRGGWLLVSIMFSLRPSLDVSAAEIWLVILAAYSTALRMTRPFINDIVLLERCPIRARKGKGITMRQRTRALHFPNTGDLIGRWLLSAAATSALLVSVVLSMWFVVGGVTNNWRWGPAMVQLGIPMSMWMAAIYTTVVKFISYLDLRIRREGWEVELIARAAAQELRGTI